MLARCSGGALLGLEAVEVSVEVDIAPGLPGLLMVGLADAAVQESRERVRAAVRNSGLRMPLTRVIVNLAPADLRKEGPAFDLPIALAVLVLFSAIQWLGVRAGGASQELLSLVKAVAFLGLAAASFLMPSAAPEAATNDPTVVLPEGSTLWIGAVLALQAVITTFDGWASPVYFAEEFSDPARDLPRSLIGGVLAVLALYLLINGALLHVLPIQTLSQATLPAADAARGPGERGGQPGAVAGDRGVHEAMLEHPPARRRRDAGEQAEQVGAAHRHQA